MVFCLGHAVYSAHAAETQHNLVCRRFLIGITFTVCTISLLRALEYTGTDDQMVGYDTPNPGILFYLIVSIQNVSSSVTRARIAHSLV